VAGGGGDTRILSRGAGFAAVEGRGGSGCKVVLEGLQVETGGGRSQGAALRVVDGCALSTHRCAFRGSVVASGQQTSLHLMQCKIEGSPAAGLSVTDGAQGVLEDSVVSESSGDGLYVSGDGPAAEERRRKEDKAGGGGSTAAEEEELEELWRQAITYKLTRPAEVASMRRDVASGKRSIAHYTTHWRRRLQKVEHGCPGNGRCIVCRRAIVRQNLYGEETETLLVCTAAATSCLPALLPALLQLVCSYALPLLNRPSPE
jgi:hypothetical protein